MSALDPIGLRRIMHQLARDDFGVFAMCAFQNLNDEPYSTTGTFRRLRIN